jgi:hypothetical protein
MSGYIERFLARICHTPRDVADRNDKNPPCPVSVVFVSDSLGESSKSSTADQPPAPWPPRPAELANWPRPWRERWGLLANRFEEVEGISFPESERRAFAIVKAEHSPT